MNARTTGAVLALMLALPGPALAHRLKVFAALDGGTISGHAFFIGGGRPKDAPVSITDETGAERFAGRTDADGGFSWPVPGDGTYSVTVSSGDGHVARMTVTAGAASPAPVPAPAPAATVQSADPATLETVIAATVQREILPLRQQIDALENRLRLTDILSGIFLILGAAGGYLWLKTRGTR